MGVMNLSEKSTGFVLLGAYHYLQAEDLMLTCRTWRSLVVTSLLVAAHMLCETTERDNAMAKLRNSVAHWWSAKKADSAFEFFTRRETFQKEPLNQHTLAALYFDLRARALEMAGQDDDSSSGLAVFELSLQKKARQEGISAGIFSTHHGRKPHTRPFHTSSDLSERSRERSGASLTFSASKSGYSAGINDGYASDHSVVSI